MVCHSASVKDQPRTFLEGFGRLGSAARAALTWEGKFQKPEPSALLVPKRGTWEGWERPCYTRSTRDRSLETPREG